jgi:ribosomal protein S18 acetylase RimI-like enzyme
MSESANEVQIQPLDPRDDAQATSLLAEALSDLAPYHAMFPSIGEADLPTALKWMFSCRLALVRCTGGVILAAYQGGNLVAVGSAAGVAALNPPLWAIARSGMLMWPLYYGFDSFLLAKKTGETMDANGKAAHGVLDWELMMMAVKEGRRGSGLGSKLIERLLDEIQTREGLAVKGDDRPKVRIGLDTQKEKNIAFYSRLGFQVTSDKELELPSKKTFRNITMILEL